MFHLMGFVGGSLNEWKIYVSFLPRVFFFFAPKRPPSESPFLCFVGLFEEYHELWGAVHRLVVRVVGHLSIGSML